VTQYRYLFADLITNTIIGELPLTAVNFTAQLNAAGSFTGSLQLSDLRESALNINNSTIPGRTAIYVDRDGLIVWAGILWSREYDSQTQTLMFIGAEFETYFERRRVAQTQTFVNKDQLEIARSLFTYAQSLTNGNIGIQVGAETSGVLVSRTFYGYEQKSVYQAMLDLSQAGTGGSSSAGFDFNIHSYYDGSGNIVKQLVLGYPMSGIRYTSTSISVPTFEFPAGNINAYRYSEDGMSCANTFTTFGAGSNEGQLQQTATATSQLTAGWPLLEDIGNYSDINDTTLLSNIASGRVAAVQNPPINLTLTVPANQTPTLGSYGPGDDVRVRIIDDRFPNGLDAIYRLVSLSVSAGETSAELVTITLTLPTTS
jgi:hypothetical protein